MTSLAARAFHARRIAWLGRIALLSAGAVLAACTAPATPRQEYPALQPIDDLLAQADSAFPEPPP